MLPGICSIGSNGVFGVQVVVNGIINGIDGPTDSSTLASPANLGPYTALVSQGTGTNWVWTLIGERDQNGKLSSGTVANSSGSTWTISSGQGTQSVNLKVDLPSGGYGATYSIDLKVSATIGTQNSSTTITIALDYNES